MSENIAKCHRREGVLVDCHVEADLSGYIGRFYRRIDEPAQAYIERRAKELERLCRELEDFIRDHRSRDPLSLEVVRERKDLCSHCGSEWETWTEGGETFCAHCGATVEERPVSAKGAA